MEREYVDLQALQQQVKEGLAERFPDRLWVKAEIAQWAPHRGGHCYLSLVQHHGGETVAEARAVIWRSRYELLRHFFEEETGTPLQAGLTVLVRVQVTFHEVYGYSLVIDDLDPAFTVGELALERRRTLERLAAEGYMELQRELGLPRVPYRLAVISARRFLQTFDGECLRLPLRRPALRGADAGDGGARFDHRGPRAHCGGAPTFRCRAAAARRRFGAGLSLF